MKEYKLPKYIIIANNIINRIQSNELLPGSRVPSENEIIRDFKVSNTTARKVLQEIENEGWVTKVQGKGTIVRDLIVERAASKILSFTKNMKEKGLEPSTRLIDSEIVDSDVPLNVGGNTYIIKKPVFKIRRLRMANGIPMMFETRYISMAHCPAIDKEDMEQSLYIIYNEKYHHGIKLIEQELSAIILDDFSIKIFDLEGISPGMRVDGVTFNGDNLLLEGEKSIYRADKYKFSVQAVP